MNLVLGSVLFATLNQDSRFVVLKSQFTSKMWIGSDIIYDHYHRRIKSRIFRFCSCGERVPKIQEMRGRYNRASCIRGLGAQSLVGTGLRVRSLRCRKILRFLVLCS
jgi:hypothetical protein